VNQADGQARGQQVGRYRHAPPGQGGAELRQGAAQPLAGGVGRQPQRRGHAVDRHPLEVAQQQGRAVGIGQVAHRVIEDRHHVRPGAAGRVAAAGHCDCIGHSAPFPRRDRLASPAMRLGLAMCRAGVPRRAVQPGRQDHPVVHPPAPPGQQDEDGLRDVLGRVPVAQQPDGGAVNQVDVPADQGLERRLRPLRRVGARQLGV
jgi:hypothetical protein